MGKSSPELSSSRSTQPGGATPREVFARGVKHMQWVAGPRTRQRIEIKYMYFDVGLPYIGIPVPMNVRAGHPAHGDPAVVFRRNGRNRGIRQLSKIDPVNINPFYFKPAEGIDWTERRRGHLWPPGKCKTRTFTIGGYGHLLQHEPVPV